MLLFMGLERKGVFVITYFEMGVYLKRYSTLGPDHF
jgi:hypothetical protein